MSYDVRAIKAAASGRWVDILSSVGSIPIELLDGRNHPCPRCGGSDRFRMIDTQAGAVFCNQCFSSRNGDGFASLQWSRGVSFPEALKLIAEYLGVSDGSTGGRPRIVAEYDYLDERGELLFQAVRLEPKSFRQRRPDGNGGWSWSVKGVRHVPYMLPDLIAKPDNVVFIVEGEKDADRLHSLGLTATCNAGGAGKWKSEHAEHLRGRSVAVLPDNDEPGVKHADLVARLCHGIATSIRVVDLPGLPPKGDVSDWLDGGGTVEELQRIVESAVEWDPSELPVRELNPIIHPADDLYDLANLSGRTDAANAKRFIDRFHAELLYVPAWRRWLCWDGSRWVDDNGVGVQQRAQQYSHDLWMELARLGPMLDRTELIGAQTFIRWSNQKSKIHDFLSLAQSDERVVTPTDSLNRHPSLFNVANGTIDLETGELRLHDPSDRLTQIAAVKYDASAKCSQWLATLELVFDGKTDLIEYVQTLLGYCLSGNVDEHILPICYGGGCNGKSTIWNVIIELMGDYAAVANESLLMGSHEGHPTDRAALYQKRFVPISEPERGAKLRESRTKELTGDAVITARRMREDFWSFKRTHKFWISSNHLPRISGQDEGIWRRVKLIPFTVDLRSKVEPVPDMTSRLIHSEGSGILNWLLAGWRLYRERGKFIEPEAVKSATGNYRTESDALGEFLADCCVTNDKGAVSTAKELYDRYVEWIGSQEKSWSKTAFGRALSERFEKEKPTAGPYRKQMIYRGIRLATENDENQEKQALLPVDPSHSVNSIEMRNSRSQPDNWCQLGAKGEIRRCECGSEMVPAVAIGGWQNWDCPTCGAVVPVPVEEAVL